MMDFEKAFNLLLKAFQDKKIDFALIGGFALHVAGYTRATQDIDFLVLKEKLSEVKNIMKAKGYELLFESDDVVTFDCDESDLGRVDFLLAHRKYAKAMLSRARNKSILHGKFSLKVVIPEDLVGLKVQSSANDPGRFYQDMADIEAIIKANLNELNMELVREYFQIFKREAELDQLLKRVKA
ncbi:MAG: nucleotidyltransferase [bacterium]